MRYRPRAGVRPRQPGEGGHTSPDELGTKCRMHHNFKTFAHGWVDDQYRDNNGRLVSEVVSPEGIRFPGPAETNTDLFPASTTSPGTSPRPISIQLLFVAATRSPRWPPSASAAESDQGQAPPTTSRTRRQPQTTTHHGMAARRTGIPPTPRTPPAKPTAPAVLKGRPRGLPRDVDDQPRR